MSVESRVGDKNWDVYDEKIELKCDCGRGKKIEHYRTASHEKVPRIERDHIRTEIFCNTCKPGSV
ncbi:hypothetical protein D1872_168810 [compost metagenome]